MPHYVLAVTGSLGFTTGLFKSNCSKTDAIWVQCDVSVSDFSNVISKSDVKSLAEADEQEVVAEVQVKVWVLEHPLSCPY